MDKRAIQLERFDKLLSATYWTDCNFQLIRYAHRTAAGIQLEKHCVPDLARPHVSTVQEQVFEPCAVGDSFGPSWATVWIRARIRHPCSSEWQGRPLHLLFDAGCEALVYRDGQPVQGLTGGDGSDARHEYLLAPACQAGCVEELMVEVACNGMFGVGDRGMINPPDPCRRFTLSTVELAGWHLFHDFSLLVELAKDLDQHSSAAWAALACAQRVVDLTDVRDERTWPPARLVAEEVLGRRGSQAQRGGPVAHTVVAVGHCHIDTAWLWPYAETRRKVARSWSTQLRLMEAHPRYVFVASQAQQFEWLRNDHPGLFEQIQQRAQSGQFVPVGGSWVEADANLPAGESLARQFLHGQRFFQQHFGHPCREFWLPDTFGYCAQLPQLMRLSGMAFFLTQKLSWNLVNKPTHSTFAWEGLDGSIVAVHFPPADTYNSQASVSDVKRSEESDKSRGVGLRTSLLLFGNGDGGGGPTEAMLERLDRLASCSLALPAQVALGSHCGLAAVAEQALTALGVEPLPATSVCAPAGSTDAAERADPSTPTIAVPGPTWHPCSMPLWCGELYFELHQGTLTSQVQTKWGNVQREVGLQQAEWTSTLAACFAAERSGGYPRVTLRELWSSTLTDQFHDVLPGSSIALAYQDVHDNIQASLSALHLLQQVGMRVLTDTLMKGTASDWAHAWAGWEPQCRSGSSVLVEALHAPTQPAALLVGNSLGHVRERQLVVVPAEFAATLPPRSVQRCAGLPWFDPHSDEESSQRAGLPAGAPDFDRSSGTPPLGSQGTGFLATIDLPPCGFGTLLAGAGHGCGETPSAPPATAVILDDGSAVLSNSWIRCVVDPDGALSSLLDTTKSPPREFVPRGGRTAILRIHPDIPFFWDAWDVMPYAFDSWTPCTGAKRGQRVTRGRATPAEASQPDPAPPLPLAVIENGPLRASVRVPVGRIGTASFVVVVVSIAQASREIALQLDIEWREAHSMLRLALPAVLHADTATYGTQFGHVRRPTHGNTSWDWAKWEVCAHGWSDLSEPGAGMSVLDVGTYGRHCSGSEMSVVRGHATEIFRPCVTQTLRLTAQCLLRSPKAPDAHCDMGRHFISLWLRLHDGDPLADRIPARAATLRTPAILSWMPTPPSTSVSSFLEFHTPHASRVAVQLSCLKLAEEDDRDMPRVHSGVSLHDRLAATLSTDEHGAGSSGTRVTVILRLFEAHGSRGPVVVDLRGLLSQANKRLVHVAETDILEQELARRSLQDVVTSEQLQPLLRTWDIVAAGTCGRSDTPCAVLLQVAPFQIVTLRLLLE